MLYHRGRFYERKFKDLATVKVTKKKGHEISFYLKHSLIFHRNLNYFLSVAFEHGKKL